MPWSRVVAVGGKGGVGKTTVAALLVSRLIARGQGPVLAVDADPNMCLDLALGVAVAKTVGGVREEARRIAAGGVAKQQLLQLRIAESLVEAPGFDLIAMGRPEGPGCYCYANNVLRDALEQIADSYPWIVIDNEAGLENLSRRIVRRADLMVFVADPSRRGLDTVLRLADLAREMGIEYGRLALVVNRLREDALPERAGELGADVAIALPDDPVLGGFGERGESLAGLPADHPAVARIDSLLDRLGLVSERTRDGKRSGAARAGL